MISLSLFSVKVTLEEELRLDKGGHLCQGTEQL